MLRFAAIMAAFAVGATVVYAQNLEVIKQRQEAMKAQGKALYEVALPMFKGEAPFDLAKAKQAFKTIEQTSTRAKTLFPPDSKIGGETNALPAIWDNLDDAMGWLDEVIKDTKAAQTDVKDEASFKEAFKAINTSCTDCHKDYRKPMKN
jgi:cytochrome c556